MDLFLILIAIHFLCDFPLQGDFMAINKSKKAFKDWWVVLIAHCFIHGLGVWAALTLFGYNSGVAISSMIFMIVSHFMIDLSKNNNLISFKTDQLLHLVILLIISIGVQQ